MGRIFENAYLVLAAAHAENSSGGLLPVKQFPQMLSATRSEAALRAVHKESVDFVGALPKNDFVDHHGTEQPLLHRAWVYQERFLASRVLFFLKDHVLWECAETIECECTPEGRHIHGWDNNNYYRRLLMGISHDKSEASFRHQWLQTVERYSPLHLTFPTDKLPALSGLAKRFLASKKDEYLAGMWKSTLLEDLAWRVQKPCPSPQPWRAPSWSWVSVDGPVKIPGIKRQNCHAKVIQVYCQPSTSDPTGPVSEGHLVLRSRVIRSLYSTIGIPLCGYRDQPEMTSFYRIYPDFQWSQAGVFTSSGGKFCCLEIGTLDNGMYEVEYFLILKPASFGNDAYERVGLLELHGANGIEEIQMAIRESPFEVVTIK
jgi:hypothetical protein